MSRVLGLAVLVLVLGATRAEAGHGPVRPSSEFDAHAPPLRYRFEDPDMDWTFGFILGTTSTHGCEIGEAFTVASRIKDGDAASWQAEWIAMADRVARRGERSLAAGHTVSACRQLQRASYYYRAGLVSMLPDDVRLEPVARRSRACLRKAGGLLDPPLEPFEVPFEGTVLPGYFRRADRSRSPRPTLLVVGGGETFAEDLWFHVGPQAFARGYNFVGMDLPGQGLLPREGKIFRPAMNVPVSAVIDRVLRRPEVDPKKLAVYGISGGGCFAPRTAMSDHRIRALAVTAAVVNAERLFATMPVARTTPAMMATFSSFHRNVVRLVAYRWGVKTDDIPGLVGANRGFGFDPARVTCPVLLLVGADEYAHPEVRRQQHECLEGLPDPRKRLVVTPADEGAASHCIGENRSLMSEVLFDWLDDMLR